MSLTFFISLDALTNLLYLFLKKINCQPSCSIVSLEEVKKTQISGTQTLPKVHKSQEQISGTQTVSTQNGFGILTGYEM